MSFYAWLGQQVKRDDDVGAFARFAGKDRVFPREITRLQTLLLRYQGMPEQREGLKIAHREWRAARRVAA